MPGDPMRPIVDAGPIETAFLDRDGVINRRIPGGYVGSWEEFEFLEGAVEALAILRASRVRTVVVTNQRGIARGLVSRDAVDEVHRRMQGHLRTRNAHADAIYLCPDLDGPMRKPAPGMLLQAAQHIPAIRFDRSVMIGDSVTDLLAGCAAGTRTILVEPDPGLVGTKLDQARELGVPSTRAVASLLDAARLVAEHNAQHARIGSPSPGDPPTERPSEPPPIPDRP